MSRLKLDGVGRAFDSDRVLVMSFNRSPDNDEMRDVAKAIRAGLAPDAALAGVAETVKESGGWWKPCSGCYDTEDGHPTGTYAHSAALNTDVGCGCHECGGLGAVWEYYSEADLAAMQEEFLAPDLKPAPDREPLAPDLLAYECALAALVAAYYRAEIGRLMGQAEHWAGKDKPHAVHHRITKADNYVQVVALFERCAQFGENPFETMRAVLAKAPATPPGTWPPSAKLHRYRDPEFVVAKLREADG